MAEFAAASSAAGVISLGLQVCTGLAKYCTDWKSYDRDLAALERRTNGLYSILEVLASLLERMEAKARPAHIASQGIILDCTDSIAQLDKMTLKCASQAHSFSGVRIPRPRYLRRALYPFRKTDILSLNSSLNDLQCNLMLALHVLQW